MSKLWKKLTGMARPEPAPPPPKARAPRVEKSKPPAEANGEPQSELPQHIQDRLDALIERMPERRLRFAQLYIETGSARGAALRAGYSADAANRASVRMLKYPDVREYIRLVRREAARASLVTIAGLLRQCWEVSEGKRKGTTPSERAAARATIARILLALPARVQQKIESAADTDTGEGWTAIRAAFEREVLGVELQESEET